MVTGQDKTGGLDDSHLWLPEECSVRIIFDTVTTTVLRGAK